MNHFMLPLDASQGTSAWGAAASAATRYGNVAMERLINDILKLGGRRENLEIKLVGGGHVLADMTCGSSCWSSFRSSACSPTSSPGRPRTQRSCEHAADDDLLVAVDGQIT